MVRMVKDLKAKGYRVALATNPLFPAIATESRIRWAGFEPEDFEIYTTYENIGFCKPNPDYYTEVLRRIDAKPEECIMVGNDVDEDMIAASSIGIKGFLLTTNTINRKNKDISCYPNGGVEEMIEFFDNLENYED